MKNQVLALPEVRDYFSDLIRILYEKDYFCFESDAIEYVTDLFSDIEQNLPAKPRKPAPPYFEKFGKGMFYTTFRKNKHTQWFVFFNIYTDSLLDIQTFLIRYVSNNHVIAKYFEF